MNAKERRKIRREQLPLLKAQLVAMRLAGEGDGWLQPEKLIAAAYSNPVCIARAMQRLQAGHTVHPWFFDELIGRSPYTISIDEWTK